MNPYRTLPPNLVMQSQYQPEDPMEQYTPDFMGKAAMTQAAQQGAQRAQPSPYKAVLEQLTQKTTTRAPAFDPDAEYVKQYEMYNKEAQAELDAEKKRLTDLENTPLGFWDKFDARPLAAWVDSQTGGQTAQYFKAPTKEEERKANIEKLRAGIKSQRQTLTGNTLDLLKQRATMRDQQLDRQLKREMLNDQIAARKMLAGMKKGQRPPATAYQAATFGKRAEDAHSIVNNLIDQGADLTSFGSRVSRSALVPQILMGEDNKAYLQAQRNFINAILRRESGASIAASEFDNANKQYFPQEGDSPEILAQKAANRARQIEGLRLEAGDLWGQFAPAPNLNVGQQINQEMMAEASGGGMPQVGDVVDGLTYIGGDPNSPQAWR